jgi:glycosyltransferase involved in cell wall biosynthesis
LWTSRHEICSELSRRGWDVLFVDPPANMARRPPAATPGPVAPGIRVVTPPPYVPFGILGRVPAVARPVIERNARAYADFVVRTVREHHDGPVDLLFNSFMPVHGCRTQARLSPQVTIYHRSDEMEQFPGWRPAYRAIEEGVAAAADLVVCVSDTVRDGIAGIRPDAVVVPNGVDVHRFGDGVGPDARLSRLGRPVSVMVGVFDRRVDQTLLDAAASCSQLVMVGRRDGIQVPAGATWLGHVDHSEIPGILAAADVGVVAYRPGWAGDVLKVYEYLAAGLPIVTSHAPDGPGIAAAVSVTVDAGSFAAAITTAAAQRTADTDAARRALAEANSWPRRVDRILSGAGLAGVGAAR